MKTRGDTYELLFMANANGDFITTTGAKKIADRDYFRYLKQNSDIKMTLRLVFAIRQDRMFRGILAATLVLKKLQEQVEHEMV